jgi:hypothetical protein
MAGNLEQFRIRSNTVNVCVDRVSEYGLSGREYNCYHQSGETFYSMLNLVEHMGSFFDFVQYPKSTVRTRTFLEEKETTDEKKPDMVLTFDQISKERGNVITFYVTVESRVNASWQGQAYCVETDCLEAFSSYMALIDFADRELKKITGNM